VEGLGWENGYRISSTEKQEIFDCQCFSGILEMVKKSKISAIAGVAGWQGHIFINNFLFYRKVYYF